MTGVAVKVSDILSIPALPAQYRHGEVRFPSELTRFVGCDLWPREPADRKLPPYFQCPCFPSP